MKKIIKLLLILAVWSQQLISYAPSTYPYDSTILQKLAPGTIVAIKSMYWSPNTYLKVHSSTSIIADGTSSNDPDCQFVVGRKVESQVDQYPRLWVGFKHMSYGYLGIKPDNTIYLNGGAIGGWEAFSIEITGGDLQSGEVYIVNYENRLLAVDGAGGPVVGTSSRGGWERLAIEIVSPPDTDLLATIPTGTKVAVKSVAWDRYLKVTDRAYLSASGLYTDDPACQFTVLRNGNWIGLQSPAALYTNLQGVPNPTTLYPGHEYEARFTNTNLVAGTYESFYTETGPQTGHSLQTGETYLVNKAGVLLSAHQVTCTVCDKDEYGVPFCQNRVSGAYSFRKTGTTAANRTRSDQERFTFEILDPDMQFGSLYLEGSKIIFDADMVLASGAIKLKSSGGIDGRGYALTFDAGTELRMDSFQTVTIANVVFKGMTETTLTDTKRCGIVLNNCTFNIENDRSPCINTPCIRIYGEVNILGAASFNMTGSERQTIIITPGAKLYVGPNMKLGLKGIRFESPESELYCDGCDIINVNEPGTPVTMLKGRITINGKVRIYSKNNNTGFIFGDNTVPNDVHIKINTGSNLNFAQPKTGPYSTVSEYVGYRCTS